MKKWLIPLVLTIALLGGCEETVEEVIPTETPTPTSTPTLTTVEATQGLVLPCYPYSDFHPITGSNRTNLTLGGLMYEGLFALTPDFTAESVLCKSYTVSEDGLTWYFTLDATAKFSDGEPLTATEVVSSLKLAQTSELYGARFIEVIGIKEEEGQVVLTLTTPNSSLPALLDIPIVKEQADSRTPLGTGAYVLTGSGDNLSLHNWRGDMPQADIELYPINEAEDMIHAFETRDISAVSTDFTGINALGFSGSFESQDYPTSEMYYIGFQTAEGLCTDVALRQVLQQAFDRDYLATVLLARHATVATLPLSPESPYYDESLGESLSYSMVDVSQGLLDLGWEIGEDDLRYRDGQLLELTFVVNSDNTSRLAMAEYLAENLANFGIAVTLEKLTWEDYVTALAEGDFDLYFGEVRLTADFDITNFLLSDGSLNFGGYASELEGYTLADYMAGDYTPAEYLSEEAVAEELERQTLLLLLSNVRTATQEEMGEELTALYTYLTEDPPFVVLGFKHWSLLTQWGMFEHCTPTQQNAFYGFEDWVIDGG